MKEHYISAHKQSIYNRVEVLKSEKCGCFHCMAVFEPKAIVAWTDFKNKEKVRSVVGLTALCPYCGIDSVLGSESGYPIENTFLKEMGNHWFNV